MKEFGDAVLRGVLAEPRRTDGTIAIAASFYVEEPARIDDTLRRVYLGALAEHLAHMAGDNAPAWCLTPAYFLDDPIFPSGSVDRDSLIARTPSAFRRRLLFCGPVMEKMTAILDRI